ncbi:MAG: hypothetical protein BRD45_00125 [Bacteroidetes bacterium QS_8_64_10]|nr:MAG: hypothetical protein BRD45_00125 [Bacteroidetes bacterium QS_8_64_10]
MLPRVPLWALILAAFGPDLVNTVLKLAGVEGPLETWFESATGVLIVAALIAVLYWVLRQRDGRGALLMGAVAVLHLPADLAANELPLWPDGPRMGAALYKHPAADFAVEALVVVVGWVLYRRSLPPGGRRRWPAWASLALLLVCQAMFSFGWRPW